MGWIKSLINRRKLNKVTKEQCVDAILELEKQRQVLKDGIVIKEQEISELMKKGKAEKSNEIRLMYAKEINYLKNQKVKDAKRAEFLMYDIDQLTKLQAAIEDKNFYVSTGKVPLNKLIADPVALTGFLTSALKNKTLLEDSLVNAEETFAEVESMVDENETIYGANKKDDELLSMFEEADTTENEVTFNEIEENGEAALIKKKEKENL
jgi:hypothetical protein